MIYVVQQGTNLPLFFRHVPGNVIDVSTLIRTIAELKAYGINTKFAILDAMEDHGVFILYSSRPIRAADVLEKYYIRQQIEQVFDICKNNTNLLPLRVHSEDTFRGHLVLAFIASVIVKMLQDSLKKSGCSVHMALYNLGRQHCKVFDDVVLPCEPVKKVNDILKALKIKCPLEIRTDS